MLDESAGLRYIMLATSTNMTGAQKMVELTTDSTSLVEMLAYMKRKARSGRLLVREERQDGEADSHLYFVAGRLVDVRSGTAVGDDIVYRLLGSKLRQRFSWQNDVPPPGESISRADEYFLLATLGLQDDPATMRRQLEIEQAMEVTLPPPTPSSWGGESVVAASQPAEAVIANLPANPQSSILKLQLPVGRAVAIDEVLAVATTVGVTPEEDNLGHLLDGLAVQNFSGYFCWERRGARGVILFYAGLLIAVRWLEPDTSPLTAAAAYLRIEAEASQHPLRSHATLTALDDTLLHSYSALLVGERMEQPDRGLGLTNLLISLSRTAHTGCVRISNGDEAACIFLTDGIEMGRYRAVFDTLEPDSTYPFSLAREQGAQFEVYVAPDHERLVSLGVVANLPDLANRLTRDEQRQSQPPPLPPSAPTNPPARRSRRAAPITQKIDTGEVRREIAAQPADGRTASQQLIADLQQVAREVLTTKAGSVMTILEGANRRPADLDKIVARARQATRMLIGVVEYQQLSSRFDSLLAAYRQSQQEG